MRDCTQIQEKLTSYALGELSLAETEKVRLHVAECEGCRAALGEIEPTLELIRNALAARPAPPRLTNERREEVLKTVRPGRLAPIPFQRVAAMAAILVIGAFVGAMGMFFMLKSGGMLADRGVNVDTALSFDDREDIVPVGASSILTVASAPLPLQDRHVESVGDSETGARRDAEAISGGTDSRLKPRTSATAVESKAREEWSASARVPVSRKPEPSAVVLDPEKAKKENVAEAEAKREADEVRVAQLKPPELEGIDRRIDPDQPRKLEVAGAPAPAPATPASESRARQDARREVASIPPPKPRPSPPPAVRHEPAKPARIPVTMVRGRYKAGDWNVNPGALERLAGLAGSATGLSLNADFQVQTMDVASSELAETRPLFVFMSGTRNFTFSNKESENLREYLLGGGCVWADAGRPGRQTVFDLAFRREIKRVVPALEFKPAQAGHAMYDRLHKGVGLAAGVGGAKTPVEIGWLNGRPAVLLTVNGYGALWDGNGKAVDGFARDTAAGPAAAGTNETGHIPLDPVALDAGRFGVNAVVYLMLGNPDALRAVPLEYRPTGLAPGVPAGAVTNKPAAGVRN